MWTSAQVLLAKTVLYVKIFPEVTGAAVNQDLQAEIVKEVCGLEGLPFWDQLNLHPLIDIFVTSLCLILSQKITNRKRYIILNARNVIFICTFILRYRRMCWISL